MVHDESAAVNEAPAPLIGDDVDRGIEIDPAWLATESTQPSGSETILLVDDDDQVRLLVCYVLKAAGYRVLEADRAEVALQLANEHGGPIALLLTDVVMPGWNGRQLADHLKERRPDLRELYMSGYVSDSIIRHGMMQADVPFIQKPFAPATLVRVVRQVLDHPSAG